MHLVYVIIGPSKSDSGILSYVARLTYLLGWRLGTKKWQRA